MTMNDKKRIQEEVEKTLESLNGIQKAWLTPIYSRVSKPG